ncbi:OmpA family protein [Paraburkholderia sp. SARCC-3016]|nr:OmpA family protein [Paraburkholderia sp. SARCC-3016]MDQ7976149.1 OmpA family protein [Paraburkholderia sp. SARCC-3016]
MPSNTATALGNEGLGYPFRTMVALAAVLALAVLWFIPRLGQTPVLLLTAFIGLLAFAVVWLRTRQLISARSQNARVLAALGAAASEIPVRLRTNMPLVVVTGDGLPAIFDRVGEARFVHIGEGAIWIRAERPRDLPKLSVAVRQWRNGRAPEAFVLSVAPALHSDLDTLTQRLRVMRQAIADASRMLGARLPGYLAIYQRVTADGNSHETAAATIDGVVGTSSSTLSKTTPNTTAESRWQSSRFMTGITGPLWYGVSSTRRILPAAVVSGRLEKMPENSAAGLFESITKAAEANALSISASNAIALNADALSADVQRANSIHRAVTRAAALPSLIDWTWRIVIEALTDDRQPSAPCTLHGVGWVDCGPATGRGKPWERDVESQTAVVPATMPASPSPWPLPQPLIEAMPQQRWVPPRLAALAHAVALTACAAAIAFWGAASNNVTLIDRIGANLQRYAKIPAAQDAARRDALQALVADRDQLEHYARLGVPLHLSFGMYRGAQLMPALNDAIATYEPPEAPPAVVTLDSMSLFDSGNAQLKPGSTRAMVGALEMIRANPRKRILVAGHTDATGAPDSNLRLSIARAAAVRDWLVDASGMPATQFAIQGYGDTRPIASNDASEGRAKNRRVEITLVPDTAPQRVDSASTAR